MPSEVNVPFVVNMDVCRISPPRPRYAADKYCTPRASFDPAIDSQTTHLHLGEAEDAFTQDVALDFAGAAADGEGGGVEKAVGPHVGRGVAG